MAHTVVDAQAIEALHGRFRPLSEPLGLTAFKVNRIELPAGEAGPEHDHTADGQEEVYAVVAGSGVLRVDGNEVALSPGHFVFCPPEARRQMVAGDEGLTWIGIGAPAAG